MLNSLVGEDGQPLPDGEVVFRFAIAPKDFDRDGKPLSVSLGSFELSSQEKFNPPPRLSVFAASVTTYDQGWLIAGAKHDLVFDLSVHEVRLLRIPHDNPSIDVVWHHIESDAPGAQGHAGLIGLAEGDKLKKKKLRFALAELAGSNARKFAGGS